MAIIKAVALYFLAVICACAAIGIDYALIRYHRPGTLLRAILAMVLYTALSGLLTWWAILGARVSRKSCRK